MVFCKNQAVQNYDLWVDLFKSLPKLCISASFWGSNKESASCKETKSDAELSSICTWAVTKHGQPIAQHVHNIYTSECCNTRHDQSLYSMLQVPDCQAPIPTPPYVPCTNSSPGSWHHAISQRNRSTAPSHGDVTWNFIGSSARAIKSWSCRWRYHRGTYIFHLLQILWASFKVLFLPM